MTPYLNECFKLLNETDPEIAKSIHLELERQQGTIELIASENIVSEAVLSAVGNIMTNKYAEGYPEKRYYGGCQFVDMAENLAINRAKDLFGAESVNVQPHSGVQANAAVYFAVLNPGDAVMGMNLNEGGHLTHGSKVNMSGRFYNFFPYGVNPETEIIDYDEVLNIAKNCRPKMIVCGASAYPRNIDFKKFKEIADEVGALLMVDMAHIAGLVAAGLHQNPVPFADFVTTTTHKTLRGPRGGMILCKKEFENKVNKAIFPGTQGGPLMHVIAGKAVCFKEAMSQEYKSYMEMVVKNCKIMSETFIKNGMKLVSGGTDNHLLLINLKDSEVTGKDLEERLDSVKITTNKNTVPGEKRSPQITSGVRIGTAAITSRGMKELEARVIAELICKIQYDYEKNAGFVRGEVKKLTQSYPVYKEIMDKNAEKNM